MHSGREGKAARGQAENQGGSAFWEPDRQLFRQKGAKTE